MCPQRDACIKPQSELTGDQWVRHSDEIFAGIDENMGLPLQNNGSTQT